MQVSAVATDLLDAADKHVPTLSLNARRKFFHALAVAMFLLGLAVDVRLPAHCSRAVLTTPSMYLHADSQRSCTCLSAPRLRFHVRRVCPILCALPVRCRGASLHVQIVGQQR